MADTYDSLAALYQSDNTLNSRYMLAWLYLQSGQYLQGQNVMSALPSWFTLTEDDLAEYQDLQSLYTMLREIYEGGETLNELSTSQIGQFVSIALAETGLAAVYARNILINIIDFEYSEPVTLPDQLKSTMTEEAYNKLLSSPLPKMLELYPNPSKDFVFLGYQFERNTRGVIEIRDVLGKLIYNIPFEGMQDQITILTKTWTPGIYFVNLVVNEKVTETTKFTLIN
jgi:hypothetical protein